MAIDPAEAVNVYAERQGWPFRCSTKLTFARPELNRLRDIWCEKAVGQPVPYRSDFDARTLKPVLRNIAIVERVSSYGRIRLRLRLIGSEIAGLFGEHTGRHLDEAVPPALLPRWETIYDAVLDSGRPFRVVTNYDHPRVNYLSGESLLAPMLDSWSTPTMLLCCVYFRQTKETLNLFRRPGTQSGRT